MLTRLHRHFGTAGLIVAIVALVTALGGGAYAATSGPGSGGGKATASAKGKPGPRGKTGKTGPTGPAGPQGLAGANGVKGDTGLQGKEGATGKEGPMGKEGKEGKAGKDGKTGFTDVLPPGKTETGAWAIGITQEGQLEFTPIFSPISFSIPLAGELDGAHVHFIDNNGKEQPGGLVSHPNCLGTAPAPAAIPGHLCVYQGAGSGSTKLFGIGKPGGFDSVTSLIAGAGKTGVVLGMKMPEFESAWGTWAVTAEEE
jgi:hypothetical protein